MENRLVQVEGFDPTAMPGLTWFKSSDSTPGTYDECVGFASLDNGQIAVAATRDEGATPLTFDRREIRAMVSAAKRGELDHLTV
jgi:hypothetical protein